MENEDRRKHDESFRLKIVEQQGEIKALQTQTNSKIDGLIGKVAEQALKISNIESALWGYPASENAGLLEKNRSQNQRWLITFTIVNFLLWGLIGLIKPLYTKWIDDWAFNSVGEKWAREQKRPRVTHIHIHEAPLSSPPPSSP